MKKLISICLTAALGLGLLAGCGEKTAPGPGGDSAQSAASAQGKQEGGAALASFTAGTLDGGSFAPEDISAKDVTILNFWALSCGPCIVEMPDLAQFSAALPDNVQLVTVCLDGAGNEDSVREVMEQSGFEGITIISGDGDLAALASSLMYTPTTVLTDSEGVLSDDVIIGGQRDLSGTYLAAVNRVLAAGGKDEISLES